MELILTVGTLSSTLIFGLRHVTAVTHQLGKFPTLGSKFYLSLIFGIKFWEFSKKMFVGTPLNKITLVHKRLYLIYITFCMANKCVTLQDETNDPSLGSGDIEGVG